MGAVIGAVLPFAVALAASPMHVIVVVLILVSERARAKGLGFGFGRLLALALILAVVLAVAGSHHTARHHAPTTASSVGRIVIGALLLGLAVRSWRNRPKPGEEPRPSALLRRVDNVTPIRAFALGFGLTLLDPASLSLGFLAALDMAEAGLAVVGTIVVSVAFILVATITTTVPIAIYLVGGVTAERKLLDTKTWLMANEKTVMMVLFLILGALLIGRGISQLTGG